MMSSRPVPTTQNSGQTSNTPPLPATAPSGIRHRGLNRAASSGDMKTLKRRRSSIFSELSDTRKAFKASTDDLLFPRAEKRPSMHTDHEGSGWQSIPLGLALLPAVAGLIFEGGSAVVTDLTLLSLAAVFLNWSVRIPWTWYRSAQAIRPPDEPWPPMFDPIIEEENEASDSDDPALSSSQELPVPKHGIPSKKRPSSPKSPAAEAAQKELQAHELLALLSCFVFPMAGAWLLHAIRSQLSRPSEGLVSNYNLTVFLLAAEIRPLAHLIKMIQSRTLYLQKVVSTESLSDSLNPTNTNEVLDLTRRIEELEAHIADEAEKQAAEETATAEQATATEQLTSDATKSMQSEVDALNRAVRRYEKRTTLSSMQTDARIQDLENRLQDALVIAAATQRSVQQQQKYYQSNNFAVILLKGASSVVTLPMKAVWTALNFPIKLARRTLLLLGFNSSSKRDRDRDRDRAWKEGRRMRGGGSTAGAKKVR